jgi:AbrB family looped-hinge helix DNA binding protein
MNSAKISTKGQSVIPNRFRKALPIQAGDKVSFALEGEKLVLRREQPKRARLVRGKFGWPVLVAPSGAGHDAGASQGHPQQPPVSHLLDVNFLLACAWSGHADHARANRRASPR